ncbi:eukaryotic translation initiation factor 5 [Choristoneura rosaceana nucleopolyhedrovirus]|uniref:Eukaryotic translation initiation factor 5 n=1 Tax=Choristoneura rosaceana nucleopolyhedrovirus TaxID=58094 RepID=S5N3Z2_9ABAC|nr:eukaryotic translation initiation factor 5 [Choristoneura rosaceana nucleopolyhedrovirus]AGR57075.1 eukaryotic translation initiation factor 5 [Choristoneura rosaceana nucleopolyhedrovirus]
MGTVNVNRNVADAFYRYKMPRICAKVEGKGNGIKTVIVNMPEIAKALGRPAIYPTKYFGCELGAQTQVDYKNERFIVNGSHDSVKLQDLLDGFIRKFVLCPECDNPETELIVSAKKNIICQGCKACGYHGTLHFSHKLNTFILKNPPAQYSSTQCSSLKKGNRGKRSKRSKRSEPGTNGNYNSENNNDDAKPEEKASAPASVKARREKKLADDDDDDDNDGTWTVDVSEAAVRARMQDLTEGVKSMTLNEDLKKNEKQRIKMFHAFIKQKHATCDVSQATIATELLHEAERLEVKSKAPLVLFEVLVRPAAFAGDVRKYRALLLQFTRGDLRAQRAALTALCVLDQALLPKVAGAFKLLYDLNVVEKKAIVEWFYKPSRKALSREEMADVRRRAQPFLDWLQQAEDSSDSAEELELVLGDCGKATPITAVTVAPRVYVDDDGEDAVDIDAI